MLRLCTGLALAALTLASPARAEADRIRVSFGYGTPYLPLMVMKDRGLIEKHAAERGLGTVTVDWKTLDGANVINDAMLAGGLDVAGTGVPGFITLWGKARAIPSSAVIGVSALSRGAVWLNTNKPGIKSLKDLTETDKIAVPGIKTSYAAFALQMAAAKELGIENYGKLDHLTVGLSHPDAYTALVGGRTEITAHLASPPFSYSEVEKPGIHRVFSTADLLGPLTALMTFSPKRFADANPKLMDAFVAAQAEANTIIAEDKERAAATYLRVSGLKIEHDLLLKILNDPENGYEIVPEGVMTYADFMARAGLIKVKPAIWTDLFIPALHSRAGS